ncbi:MAG: M3 family metallopeptidase [Acidobacteriia bacterium]|nr:M3 family metallopeptidase [Terriglobia bacterium]MYG02097.1 M3 family metallopeptidase [Terriglobia bacterium]MYK08180.1 M3 family metallopeptidase [Terriglobia bacterium]
MTNPLVEIQFDVPFDTIRAEHVEPAIDQLLDEAGVALAALAEDDRPATYDRTLGALESLGEKLGYAMGVVGHLESVATYPEQRAAFNAVQPRVSAFFSSIPLNEGVWKRLKAFAASSEAQAISPTRKRLLNKTVDSFRRSGAELDAEGKARLLEINIELAKLTTKFSENVLDATNAFELVIDDEAGLAGLPATAIEAARESAESKGLQGWRFTLQAPSYLAVMTYLDDAPVRETLYREYSRRAASGEFDNREHISRILALRKEKAELLGYTDFADLVLEDRMAKSGSNALAFINELRRRTQAVFERENQELRDFCGGALAPWDVAYQAERLRKERYDFDEEDLRPYFPYEGVLAGLFDVSQQLFGVRIERRERVPVWDKGVDAYALLDADGSHLGSFYADYFPRENKRGGAWMDSLITGEPTGDGFSQHLGLNCGNLTPPTGGKPALLTHREVETIFHEFGHLLHHLLSRVEVKSLAGTNVAWDWVELPSQIMENWCWERAALDLFAKHHLTGQPISEELLAKMKRAKNFRSANAQMRQLGFASLDLALHIKFDPDQDGDVMGYSRGILQAHSPTPLPPDYAMVAGFTHLFSSPVGYGAGYYSYKWSEMLDADAFTRFAREGIFNSETGKAFRCSILEKGDSAEPEDLFRAFMDRDPDPEALLRRLGLAA